jgi:hypothetical protein
LHNDWLRVSLELGEKSTCWRTPFPSSHAACRHGACGLQGQEDDEPEEINEDDPDNDHIERQVAKKRTALDAFGWVDTGGASLQVSFAPQESSILGNVYPVSPISFTHITNSTGSQYASAIVYSHSWNGLGQREARKRMQVLEASELALATPNPIRASYPYPVFSLGVADSAVCWGLAVGAVEERACGAAIGALLRRAHLQRPMPAAGTGAGGDLRAVARPL